VAKVYNKPRCIEGEILGQKLSLAEAVRRYGEVSYQAAYQRLNRGWPFYLAVITPKLEAGARRE